MKAAAAFVNCIAASKKALRQARPISLKPISVLANLLCPVDRNMKLCTLINPLLTLMGRCRCAMFVALAISAFNSSSARAALLAYEPFTNAPGTDLIGSSDGFGFSGGWLINSGGGVTTNTSYGLKYTDASGNALVTDGGAGFFQGSTSANTSAQPIRLFAFSRGTNGTDGTVTWISFIAVRQGPVVAGNNPYPRGANVPHDIDNGAIQKLAIGNSTGAATNTVGLIPLGNAGNLKPSTVLFSVTNFIVVRVEHVANALDNAYLFVNPTLSAEPSIAQANTNSLGSFDFSFDRLRIFAGGNASAAQPYAEMVVDEYRMGESYADVAPYVPGTNPPPPRLTITNTTLKASGLVLSGTGGSNNAGYYVLSTNNLAIPLTNWPAINTNQFDSAGNFIVTNPYTGAALQFYSIRIAPPPSNPPAPGAFFVAPNGNDLNSGTIDSPLLTITKGLSKIGNGGLLYLRGGTYPQSTKLNLTLTGSVSNTIRVWAYNGESPVINSAGNGSDGISISGRYYHLKGITVMNAGHNGINISGHSNIIEACTVHDNGNTGLHITGGQSSTTFPSYNLILNCDAYLNYDPPVGGNADGFSAKWDLGPGNVFSGCRAWWNSDDGWDLWMGNSSVTISNCWAFWNGTNYWNDPDFGGNGNGFKLGGNDVPCPHRLIHCLAFQNEHHGIDQNNNLAGQTVDQNTSWANKAQNFNLKHGSNSTPHIVRNNISIDGLSSDGFTVGTLATNNSWQVISPAANTGDLQSVNTAPVISARQADGSLPVIPFLRPVSPGRLIDQGVNIGEPFSGTAPDLGAYESP